MKAVAIGRVTPASEVTLTDVPTPRPKPGWVLVRVRALGLNHSEKILRLSEVGADYIKKPIVPGIVCQTGILGGVYVLNGFDPIKEISNGCYLTGFFSNSPTQADIDAIFSFMGAHGLSLEIGARFSFDRIADACAALDVGKVNGKIVVEM